MVTNLSKEQIALHKEQEARTFIAKKGPHYVQELATKEEREYFDNTLYCGGIPILTLISYLSAPLSC